MQMLIFQGTVPPCETEYYKERCFWKIEQTLTWAEALTACEAQAGTLATLDTQDMLDFVLGWVLKEIGETNHKWSVIILRCELHLYFICI